MKKIFSFFLIPLFLIASCKKDDDSNTDYYTLDEDEITEITSSATNLAGTLQSEMFSYIAVAADSGRMISFPSMGDEKTTGADGVSLKTSQGWMGPDANGWYTNYINTDVYDYTQRVRCNDSIIDYEYSIIYDGADGSYENITRTQYVKYSENGTDLYKGYWDWNISTSGYNDNSNVRWKMAFDDWNPLNGAGSFDWYWGAISNGNTVPFYRYLNILATDAGDEWLNIQITLYDNINEIWSWEYTSPWNPVDMPELHTCGIN
jgi:hypothetical protein